ncbi:MAG: hypothetical protein SFU57_12915 [Gemmatimonadales bacterium]|nr:hypothetical protein [Gemmatimonadales bacterium]
MMMPKKPAKLRPDLAEVAFRVMQEAVGDVPKTKPPSERSKGEKNPEAAAKGSKGGLKGGPARAANLKPGKAKEIAMKAAKARWAKKTR